jgi:drug/metabolite transporter (DMT)-like permease
MKCQHGWSDWLMLMALTVMWGSAFLLTKIAVSGLPHDLVVGGRLLLASLLLLPAALLFARTRPQGARLWLYLILIAFFGNALPFFLIAWGQRSIDSGLAGILMAVMPLVTLGLAHYLVPGERLTTSKILGFAFGFAGIVVLTGPEVLLDTVDGQGKLLPMLAVLGGAVCYAIAATLARLRPPSDAVTTAAATTVIATFMVLPVIVSKSGTSAVLDATPAELVAIVLLGTFSTAVAAIVYFRLINSAGPTFVSQLNYLIPPWAVLVGIVFLGESPMISHLYALGLILLGIFFTQWKSLRLRSSVRKSHVESAP